MSGTFAFVAEHQKTVEDSVQPVQRLDDGPQSW